MLAQQSMRVTFDSGEEVDVSFKSRDLAILERDGVDLQETPPIRGSYLVAFVALRRMARSGVLSFELPETVDEFMEIADLVPLEDEDAEGNDSDPAATLGEQPG